MRFMKTALATTALLAATAGLAAPPVTVYKSPSCGCCGEWIRYLERSGFQVKAQDVHPEELDRIKRRLQVPERHGSCHTAVVDGYVVEGHVPVSAIRKLLAERPKVVGVSVPSMPPGSPGMEGPNPQPFTAFAFDAQGRTTVLESYRPPYRW